MAALIQSRIAVGLDRAAGEQLRRAGLGQLAGPVGALLGSRRVGGEEQVAAVGVEAELAARLGARHRPEAAQVRPAGEDRRAVQERQAGPPVLLDEEGGGDDRGQVDAAGQAARQAPDERVADVGAVEADDQRRGAGEARAPAGQPVVGVDEVEGGSSRSSRRSRRVAGMYWREPGGKLKTSTSTPRRRISSTWSRTQRPRCGAPASGTKLVTTRTRIALSVSAGVAVTHGSANWRTRVWIGDAGPAEHGLETNDLEVGK